MSKRKHTTLSLQDKCDIIKKLESGITVRELAKTYDVGKSTIGDIKKKKDAIISHVSSTESGPGQRKTLKSCQNPDVESAVFTWFLQQRAQHIPLSGEIICEKAKWFYSQITGRHDFQASSGWLEKFKKRHGIRQLTITGEKLSADESAVEPFKRKFLDKIKEMDLNPHQVYNADESGLFWKVLPNKTLAHQGEKSAPGRKVKKDRITFMPCANASGSHKLRMLVVGKANKPRAFKRCTNLPVVYMGQKKRMGYNGPVP